MRVLAALVPVCAAISACGAADPDAPPTIVPDASVCAECDMIISDLRFATALVVRDERGGGRALLFDDLGDQLIHEREHPEYEVLARWVHDHGTEQWVEAESAWYLRSDALLTPMASGLAAFADRDAAVELGLELPGEVLEFHQLRAR
ncbi:nitrous oxide reductase accessory protein NosL [Engelhardtia mirabilis]|uniref:NosL n=1 Tax=Engelhardtia mirabilis TaxID=2528011 RepID=A0A518BNQ0_9BACT|nr:NosL [Planctomycetes bacterium Pla133]QDV02935.1 NosL [Planctomycetes bacterium Pla86]